ncbi:MAG TPA: NYN domain-containing protein [Actinomycetes bacterium]|nr:NYN domain-containing protein [Actinomycetes bacterium]
MSGPVDPGGPEMADVPEALLAGYLDAALATLRAADHADLPGPLRQYQTWTPKRLRHPRVLALVRRTLDLDQSFRKLVDERVLDEEEALVRLVRAGRHAEALASGESPEAVAKVGLALGPEGEAAVAAAVAAAATSQAKAEAAAVRSTLAGVESDLDAARERAEAEAAGARAAREELRAAREELRRVERERRTLAERVEGLERELAQSAAALRAARDEAAAEQRRLGGRVAELQARLSEAQRNYRALRRSAGQVDPVVAEAVGALERDLDALRRAAGLDGVGGGRGSGGPGGTAAAGPGAGRRRRRSPLAVPGGRGADDPETLAAWMGVDGVLVLVDGYNVTKHPQGFPDRGLEDQRTLLLDLCRRLARRFGAEVTVVFDGGTVGPISTRLPLGPVEVVFTDAGRTADDEIVARTNAAPPERPVVVVTSDNELRTRVTALGATITRSPALLGLAAAR